MEKKKKIHFASKPGPLVIEIIAVVPALFYGHVHVVLAGPIAVVRPVHRHFRRDGREQRRAVRAHAKVPQQHFRHGERPGGPGVLVDHRHVAGPAARRIDRTFARPFQIVLRKCQNKYKIIMHIIDLVN